ncbi:MAG: BspA family leucine-rich repeat surface protein [Bacteroidales bacterium]|nr:BspA family leucine-rich repeat surface protein [Bacteroidales bacterium]
MKSEIIKHFSGGGRLRFLLTFAIAFVLAMGSWNEARADKSYTGAYAEFDATNGKLTIKYGETTLVKEVRFGLWDDKANATGDHDYTPNKNKLATQIKSIVVDYSMRGYNIEDNNNNYLKVRHLFNNLPYLESVDLTYLDLTYVTNLQAWFMGCTSLKYINGFDSTVGLRKAHSITNVAQMFAGCHNLTSVDLRYFDASQVTTFAQMFRDCPKLATITGMSNWQNSKAENMSEMFGMCISLSEIDLSGFNTQNVKYMAHLFNMYSESGSDNNLTTIYVGNGWTTAYVLDDGTDMFYNCRHLPNFSSLNPVTRANAYVGDGGYLSPKSTTKTAYAVFKNNTLTFYYDIYFSDNYSNYYKLNSGATNPGWLEHSNDIRNVYFANSFYSYSPITCYHWFYYCSNLISISGSYNTQSVKNTQGMFYGCSKLTGLTSINMNSVTEASNMFYGCSSLTEMTLNSCDNLEYANNMFYGCSGIQYITLGANNKLADTRSMFSGCTSLKRIYVNEKKVGDPSTCTFDLSNVTQSSNMFYICKNLKGQKGSGVTSTDKTNARIDQGTSINGYFTAIYQKVTIINKNPTSPGTTDGYYSTKTGYHNIGHGTNNDYIFKGWTTSGAITHTTPVETISIPVGTLGEITVTAHWLRKIESAKVSLTSTTYTGSVVPLVVTIDNKTLKQGTDYTADKTVKNAQSYTITITGKGDYTGTKTVSLILNKASLIITPDNKTKVYGEDDPKLTYTVEGLKGSDKLTTTPTLSRSSGSTVGSYTISISNTPSAGSNYNVSKSYNTFTITAKPITVTPDALSKTYGDDDPTEFTYTVNEGGLIGSDKLTGNLSRVAGEAVGEYNIEQGSLANKNYAITIAEGAKFTINKKDINVTPLFITKEYGQDDPELKYSYTPGDLVGSDKLTGALSRTAGEAVGYYDINIGTLDNPNYNIILGASQFQIKARNLTDPVVVLESDVFVLDNGESKPGVTVYDGTKVVDPKEYTVEYTNNTAVGEGTVTVTANGNYVFNASKTFAIIDKADAYSVTYKTGNEETKKVYVVKNSTTAEPSIIREGYSIEGFYQSAAFDESTKWDFDNTVNNNLTLYIKWIANKHKVSFELDGNPFDSEQTLDYGTAITYPEPEAREGYTFSGWNPAPATMPDEDFTAVGSYIKNVHTITYTIDGAEYLTKENEYDATIAIIDNPAAKVGYKFSGWTPSTLPATMPDEDIVVTGSYIPNKHKLVFNADGVAAKTIAEFAFGTDISTVIPQEAHKTYLFTEPPTGLLMPDYDLTVDGRFEINKYNIVYKLDGEIYTTIPTDAGSTIALIENPTRDGYTFSGWKSDYTEMPDEDITISGALVPNPHTITYKEEGKELTTINTVFGVDINTTLPQKQGYKYVPSEEIPATVPDNNLVIDGKFVAIDYTLAYYLDYEEYKTVTLHFGDQIAAEAVPEQTGYKFSGWVDLPETMPDKDLTIFGTYEKLTYTITFMDGETKKSEQKLAFGDAIQQPSMTGKLGYTYVWKNCPEYMPDEDLVIVGGYEANLHKITYMVCDTVFASVMVPYGSEITAIEGPATSGNEKFAWGFIPETMPDNDITVLGTITTPVANIPENAITAKVWSYNRTIYIETAPDTKYSIVDLQGRVITTSTTKSTHDEINIANTGLLIVIVNGQSFKVIN